MARGGAEAQPEPLANDDAGPVFRPPPVASRSPARRPAGRPPFHSIMACPRGPLQRAPLAPPHRHGDTRRVRVVDNDAPPPRLMLLAVRSVGPPLKAPTAPRAATTTPRCKSGRTWSPLEARCDRPCPAPHWAIFLARGRRAPVVGQVVRPADTPLFARRLAPSLTALFSSCVCRRRPQDGARPAAATTGTSARTTRSGRLLRAGRRAPSSDLSSVLDEHVSARRRARPTDVDRPRPDARPLEGPRRVCNVVGGGVVHCYAPSGNTIVCSCGQRPTAF